MARKTEGQKIEEAKLKDQKQQTETLGRLLRGSKTTWETVRPVKSTNPNLFVTGKRADQGNYLSAMSGFYAKKSHDLFEKEFKAEREKAKKGKPSEKKKVEAQKKDNEKKAKEQEALRTTMEAVVDGVKDLAIVSEAGLSGQEKENAKQGKEKQKVIRNAQKVQKELEKVEAKEAERQEKYNHTIMGQLKTMASDYVEGGGVKNTIISSITSKLGKFGEIIDHSEEFKRSEMKDAKEKANLAHRRDVEKQIAEEKTFDAYISNLKKRDASSLSTLESTLLNVVEDFGDELHDMGTAQTKLFNNLVKDQQKVEEQHFEDFGESIGQRVAGAYEEKEKEHAKLVTKVGEEQADKISESTEWQKKSYNIIIKDYEVNQEIYKEIVKLTLNQTTNWREEQRNLEKIESNHKKEEAKKVSQDKDLKKEDLIAEEKRFTLTEAMHRSKMAISEKMLKAQLATKKGMDKLGQKMKKGPEDDDSFLGGLLGGALTLLGTRMLGALAPMFGTVVSAIGALAMGGSVMDAFGGKNKKKGGAKTRKTPGKKGFFGKIKGLAKGAAAAVGIGAGASAIGGASKTATKTGGKSAAKLGAKTLGKSAIKKVPFLGAVAGAGFAVDRAKDGDYLGAAGELLSGVVSIVPFIGTAASIAIDAGLAARDYSMGNQPNDKKGGDKPRKKMGKLGKVLSAVGAVGAVGGLAYGASKLIGSKDANELTKPGVRNSDPGIRDDMTDYAKENVAAIKEAQKNVVLTPAMKMSPSGIRDDMSDLAKERVLEIKEAQRQASLTLESSMVPKSVKESAERSRQEAMQAMVKDMKETDIQQKKDHSNSSLSQSISPTSTKAEVMKAVVREQQAKSDSTVIDLETQLNLEKTQLLILDELRKNNALTVRLVAKGRIEESKQKSKDSIDQTYRDTRAVEKAKEDKKKEDDKKSIWEKLKEGGKSMWDSFTGGSPSGSPSGSPGGSPGGGPGTTYAPGASQSSPQDFGDLGKLSAAYETKGGVSTVSTGKGDPGGISYGAYQLSTNAGTAAKYIQQSKYGNEFAGMRPGTAQFGAKWKEVAARDPKGFHDDQHNFIKKTHYDKVGNKMSADINLLPKAVQQVIWSMSVQHGKAGMLVNEAIAKVGTKDPAKLINALYDRRNEYVDGLNLGHLKKRYASERRDALAMLEAENGSTPGQASSVPASPSAVPSAGGAPTVASGGVGGGSVPTSQGSFLPAPQGGPLASAVPSGGSSVGGTASVTSGPVANIGTGGPSGGGGGATLAKNAKSYLGKGMTYSQSNRNLNAEGVPASMDCSSWVAKVVKETFGIPSSEFGGSTVPQFNYLRKNGQEVGKGQEQAGDFVAYGNSGTTSRHIAIVSSPGTQLHMSSSKKVNGGRGGIRESPIVWSSGRGVRLFRLNGQGQATDAPASGQAMAGINAAGASAGMGGSGGGSFAGNGQSVGGDSKGGSMASGTVSSSTGGQGASSQLGGNSGPLGALTGSVGNAISSATGGILDGKGVVGGLLNGNLGNVLNSSLGNSLSGMTSGKLDGGSISSLFGASGGNNMLNRIAGGRGKLNNAMMTMPSMGSQQTGRAGNGNNLGVEYHQAKSTVSSPFMAMVSGILLPDL